MLVSKSYGSWYLTESVEANAGVFEDIHLPGENAAMMEVFTAIDIIMIS